MVLELECCWYERGLKQLVRENVDRIALVQISDFKIGSTTSPDRSVIGEGDIPLERLLDLILDAGYEGMFDLELVEACDRRHQTVRSARRCVTLRDLTERDREGT